MQQSKDTKEIGFSDTVYIIDEEEEVHVCNLCHENLNKHQKNKCPDAEMSDRETRRQKLKFLEAFKERDQNEK